MAHEQATDKCDLDKQKIKKEFSMGEKACEDLINYIISCKTKMTYRGLDFDGDKPRMYKELREHD